MCIAKEKFLKKYDMYEITNEDGFFIELKYATKYNFTNMVLYNHNECLLRKSTYMKLTKARDILKEQGYYIKIWDAYRPIKVQKQMFKLINDERYVSNPKSNTSNHCKGIAIDITMCDKYGNNIEMPTDFDHFGIESSRRYYNNLDKKVRDNVLLLENVMISVGFAPFETEWWHFNDTDEYDIINEEYI